MLPTHIEERTLKELPGQRNKFKWNTKRPRVNVKILQGEEKVEGLAIQM